MKFLVALPQPVPGLVIRYSYLWLEEHRKGQEEGVKDRPCAVILVTQDAEGEQLVTVLPVTHSTPTNPSLAIEIPAETKRRLGLDDARSWVVLTEANQFTWLGRACGHLCRAIWAASPAGCFHGRYICNPRHICGCAQSRWGGAIAHSE